MIEDEMIRVLIVPMAAMAETGGPAGRCRKLVKMFTDAGMEVRTCVAKDINYRKIDGIRNYELDVPMPLGLPAFIAKRMFPIAQKLGITARKTVKSFDQVLKLTGNLEEKYLRKSIASIRRAIRDFKADIVYSEFNISAMVAAKAESILLYSSVSYPTQESYACDPALAKGLNKVLSELSLPKVHSALELFSWSDRKYCPSIEELEPFDKSCNVIFLGAMRAEAGGHTDTCVKRDKILVYMGNGTIPAKKMLGEIRKAFAESAYQIYIASSYLKPAESKNIHVAARWDFNRLLDKAVLFINHGGQNSITDGLIHGVPQLMIPGKVFERIYNAKSIEKNKAGLILSPVEFNAEVIQREAEKLIASEDMRRNAEELGRKLLDVSKRTVPNDTF